MKRRLRWRTAAALGAALVAGCAAMQPREETAGAMPAEGLRTASDLKFQDVPVPAGFAYDHDRSFVWEAGSVRVGDLHYRGSADFDELVAWYLQEMTRYDWRPLSKVEDRGRTTLLFEKPGLLAEVVVRSGFGRRAYVQIKYGPKGAAGS